MLLMIRERLCPKMRSINTQEEVEMIKVTVWNEYRHELEREEIGAIYPKGIHGCIADFLKTEDIEVKTAYLDQDENHGLSDEVLENTDVLIWWGHGVHQLVKDSIVEKVHERVLKGMGLIVLHSGHHSKIFKKLMGTSCNLRWRVGDKERVWCVMPGHPIAQGIPEQFVLEQEEMYGEYFDIPQPDELIFVGWFKSGAVFRSGCTFHRGYGKIFYFQPGHEEFPTYHNEYVQQIIKNAVLWAKPVNNLKELTCTHHEEPIEG